MVSWCHLLGGSQCLSSPQPSLACSFMHKLLGCPALSFSLHPLMQLKAQLANCLFSAELSLMTAFGFDA